MLPPAHRMRRSTDFTDTLRRGARARRGAVVMHRLDAAAAPPAPASSDPATAPVRGSAVAEARPALVGLIVGRQVGNAVVRHRVSRRLRAQLAVRLDRLPAGSRTVVRALPEAAAADSAMLGRDLDAALQRLGPRVRA